MTPSPELDAAAAPRRRRGKKDAVTTTATRHATTSQAGTILDPKLPVEEQLRQAQAVLETNRAGTLMIHQQWKSTLWYLSCLVAVVTFYQATLQQQQVQQLLQLVSTSSSPLEIILQPLFIYGLALLTAVALTVFLRLPPRAGWLHPLFLLATVGAPLTGGLWWLQQQQHTATEQEQSTVDFPVVLIFYVVTALSSLFMGVQSKHLDENIAKVVQVRMQVREKKLAEQQGDRFDNTEDDDDEDDEDDAINTSNGKKFKKKKKKKKNTKKRR